MPNQEKLSSIRHSLAHVLAYSVRQLYPGAKNAIGPAIEDGFYQDFDLPQPISDKDLQKIEKKMRQTLKHWSGFKKQDVTPEQAKKEFAWNEYKTELIEEFSKDGKKLTFYTSGDFIDLCRGGHVERMKDINPEAFKLDRVAGAYWRGDEKNKMLTRIYGLAFENKEQLEIYLAKREEAKKRDHKKLGRELDLFTFSDLVGAGLPLFTPKGTIIRDALRDKLFAISKKYGMLPVTIPHLAKRKLYEISGHAEKFGNELLRVISHYDEFVMKPVNCPHHTQIFASKPRSYRDLPLRYMESTMQYRDEQPGEIGGLTRVRAITVDDGHIFCRVDQIKQEAKNIAQIIEEFYTAVGLFGKHWVSLSVRDPNHPEKYIGTEEGWEQAEIMLKEISDELKLNATRREGEAALYGPKLDYMFKDSLGREWQLATIQIDFAMPERFKLEYSGADGEKKTPVMIHRAILGSYERFMAILIEHFAGAFPLWLAPVQVIILPVSDKFNDYAEKVKQELGITSSSWRKELRVEIDHRAESIGKKIREAEMQKIPFMLIVGGKEKTSGKINVRTRGEKEQTEMIVEKFSELLKQQIENKK